MYEVQVPLFETIDGHTTGGVPRHVFSRITYHIPVGGYKKILTDPIEVTKTLRPLRR